METRLEATIESKAAPLKNTGAAFDIATYAVNFRALGFIAWSFYKFSSKDMSAAFDVRRE